MIWKSPKIWNRVTTPGDKNDRDRAKKSFLDFIAILGDSADSPFEPREDIPAWVYRCTQKVGKTSLARAYECIQQDSEDPYSVGYGLGLVRHYLDDPKKKEKTRFALFDKALRGLRMIGEVYGLTLDPDQASKFYNGVSDGLKGVIGEDSGSRENEASDIHFLMAANWRMVETFRSCTELHEWLKGLLGEQRVGELKRIQRTCERLGLSFGKPGRPRKNPTADPKG